MSIGFKVCGGLTETRWNGHRVRGSGGGGCGQPVEAQPLAIAIEPNSYVAGMLSRMPQYDERPFSRGQSEQTSFWTIAIGVAVGITIAGFLAFAVRMYFVQQALNQFNQSMQQINAESQRSVQEMRQREAVHQERALELLNQQKLEKAAAQQIANNQMRQQLDEVARKEAA